MHIEVEKKVIDQSPETVFNFLTNVDNFEVLMPENKSVFEVYDENTFRFGLSGMPEIVLRKEEQTEFSKLVFGAASSKLDFNLTIDIQELDASKSEVGLSFDGKFNAMMGMMIKGPITNFMKTLSDNMDKIS
ncbi:MAG: SRPBCC family protein [Allomuricauda sp.]|nr:MAG: SRPBCC family protein [Allomuricauda sp.]